jgi:hypothetical protein
MADPAKYDPEYDFTGFQAVNPARPLPAPQVDNELANIASAINGLVSATKDIRRADGALRNGIVTADSLSTDVLAALGPNGALVLEAVAAAENAADNAAASQAAAATSEASAADSAAAAVVAAAAAAASEIAAETSAAQAALFEGPWFDTVSSLIADTTLTYSGGGPTSVSTGKVVRTRLGADVGGFTYRVAASGASDHHITTAGGVKLYVADAEPWLDAFGADMTGATFSDAAWAKFWSYLRANPTAAIAAGWGMKSARIGKGIIKLQNTLTPGSLNGTTVQGAGPLSTVIEWHSDSGTPLNLGVNIVPIFRYMCFRHVPQNADPTTWTCAVMVREGTGGGIMPLWEDVWVFRFAYADKNTGTVNNDRTHLTRCHFQDTRFVTYGQSSQALMYDFDRCSFLGKIERLLDIAGHGHLAIRNSSIIIDGTWMYLRNASLLWGNTASIKVDNVKGEFLNYAGNAGGAATRIVDFEGGGGNIFADIELDQVTLVSGPAADPSVKQLRIPAGVKLKARRGYLGGLKMEVVATAVASSRVSNRREISFESMFGCPAPTDITFTTGAAGSYFPPVRISNVEGRPNLTIVQRAATSTGLPYLLEPHVQWNNALGDNTGNIATNATGSLLFYGFPQRIHAIYLSLLNNVANNFTLNVYSDAGLTVLVGSLALDATQAFSGVKTWDISGIVGKVFTDGLYFQVTADSTRFGTVYIGHSSAV